MKYKYSNLDFTPKEINEDSYTIRAVFSTGDVDRHGEIVDQKSWILDDFMKNPVVLFGHDHYSPPVGKIVGLGYNQDGNLEGEVKFAAEEYPFAKVIWNLYKGGFMKAFSVGFSSAKVDIVNEQVILKENTLYEVSTVGVPANAMALAKSKGIDVNPLEEKFLEVEKSAREKAEAKAVEVETTEKVCEGCEEKDCESCNRQKPESDASAQEDAAKEEVTATEEVTVQEEEAVEEEKELDIETTIKSAIERVVEKEGRVLSKANRTKVEKAIEALQDLLDADNKDDKKVISENSTDSDFIKVETPAVRISIPKSGKNKAKLINKAVRSLLAEKRTN